MNLKKSHCCLMQTDGGCWRVVLRDTLTPGERQMCSAEDGGVTEAGCAGHSRGTSGACSGLVALKKGDNSLLLNFDNLSPKAGRRHRQSYEAGGVSSHRSALWSWMSVLPSCRVSERVASLTSQFCAASLVLGEAWAQLRVATVSGGSLLPEFT